MNISLPEYPWSNHFEEIMKKLQVVHEKGLHGSEIKKRRKQFGPNHLKQTKPKSTWRIFFEQFKNFIVLLLAIVSGLSFAFGDWLEGIAIVVAIIINTVIGFFSELGAVRSIDALKQLSKVNIKVRREGRLREIPANNLVVGDIVLFDAGDIITADLRILQASNLKADESALTGESVPVFKDIQKVAKEAPLAERTNMLFKGTSVTQGSGEGVVVRTGMKTELGHISSLVQEAKEEVTPLEKRLNLLGRKLIWITLTIAVIIVVVGLLTDKKIFLTIKTAIALTVAAIPEGLPIVATIALARGMWRMAKRNTLINRLSAVETLGSVTVICTDKTGTLTENRMQVSEFLLSSGKIEIVEKEPDAYSFITNGSAIDPKENSILHTALQIGVLCNNATLKTGEDVSSNSIGDPMEVAILRSSNSAGLSRSKLLEKLPEVREESFDPELKMMATFHKKDSQFFVAVKGAPEAVLESCTRIMVAEEMKDFDEDIRQKWRDHNSRMAEEGLRILALATKTVNSSEVDPYTELCFVGFIGLADPPRRHVQNALEECQKAGIRVIMITGDHPATARSIGLEVGLINDKESRVVTGKELKDNSHLSGQESQDILDVNIFARVNPKNKLDLVTLHQNHGAVVAMTGDGVNDAPALKKSDIGIAMGRRGTQVAREAADMILKDDSFKTIVVAIEQGRAIFENIRKFILFLLSGNISEIMVVAFAMIAELPIPLLPLQILYLNMIGDVFPALALGVGPGDPSDMEHPPRDPKEPILGKKHWMQIMGFGFLISVTVMGSFFLSFHWLQCDTNEAVSVSFLTLAFSRLWLVFNMKKQGGSVLRNEITQSPFIWGALVLCIGLLIMAAYVPGLSTVLKISVTDTRAWFLIFGMSFVSLFIGQVFKSIKIHHKKQMAKS